MILVAALAAVVTAPAAEVRRFAAAEARQGVAAGQRHVFVIDNSRIAKFDKRTGRRVQGWQGDAALYPHINSCSIIAAKLVCAASNYPQVPMASSLETFDTEALAPIATRSLGPGRGSLTWLDWHDGSWWACFANYGDKGGEPGRDHRWTTLVRYSKDLEQQGAWLFPEELLQRMAPKSSSGGAWNRDGLLYVTGHDRPELYALRLPRAGSRLELVAIIPTPTGGQAVDWDPDEPRLLWSIDRTRLQVVASRIPAVIVARAKP